MRAFAKKILTSLVLIVFIMMASGIYIYQNLVDYIYTKTGVSISLVHANLTIARSNLFISGINFKWKADSATSIEGVQLEIAIGNDAIDFRGGEVHIYQVKEAVQFMRADLKLINALSLFEKITQSIRVNNVNYICHEGEIVISKGKIKDLVLSRSPEKNNLHGEVHEFDFNVRGVKHNPEGVLIADINWQKQNDKWIVETKKLNIFFVNEIAISGNISGVLDSKKSNFTSHWQIQKFALARIGALLPEGLIDSKWNVNSLKGILNNSSFDLGLTFGCADGYCIKSKGQGSLISFNWKKLNLIDEVSSQFEIAMDWSPRFTKMHLQTKNLKVLSPQFLINHGSGEFNLTNTGLKFKNLSFLFEDSETSESYKGKNTRIDGTWDFKRNIIFGKAKGILEIHKRSIRYHAKFQKNYKGMKLKIDSSLGTIQALTNANAGDGFDFSELNIIGDLHNVHIFDETPLYSNGSSQKLSGASKKPFEVKSILNWFEKFKLNLDLYIEDFWLGGELFEIVKLKIQGQNQHFISDEIRVASTDINLKLVKLDWDAKINRSEILGWINFPMSSQIFKKVGISNSNMRSTFELSWTGAPWEFSLAQIKGKGDLELTKGFYLGINSNWKKVFNVVSLDPDSTLENKLKFEHFYSNFAIDNGIVKIDRSILDLRVARLRGEGAIKLIDQSLDGSIKVFPRYSKSILGVAANVALPGSSEVMSIVENIAVKDSKSRWGLHYNIGNTLSSPKLN